jgi:hypothetical protein
MQLPALQRPHRPQRPQKPTPEPQWTVGIHASSCGPCAVSTVGRGPSCPTLVGIGYANVAPPLHPPTMLCRTQLCAALLVLCHLCCTALQPCGCCIALLGPQCTASLCTAASGQPRKAVAMVCMGMDCTAGVTPPRQCCATPHRITALHLLCCSLPH